MNLTHFYISKDLAVRTVLFVLALEVLFFLLPTEGKIEGLENGYWDGVRLRLLSGNYWAKAVLSGIGAGILLILVSGYAGFLARFTDVPKQNNSPSCQGKKFLDN